MYYANNICIMRIKFVNKRNSRPNFGPNMLFTSFAPIAHKKSIVLGVVARVNSLTFPACMKPIVLREFLTDMQSSSNFPVKAMTRWIVKSKFYHLPWIPDAIQIL